MFSPQLRFRRGSFRDFLPSAVLLLVHSLVVLFCLSLFCWAGEEGNARLAACGGRNALTGLFRLADVAPTYFNLFALLRDSDGTWFPPSHVFEASQAACESLQFRLRWVCLHVRRSTLRIRLFEPLTSVSSSGSTFRAGTTAAACCPPTATGRPRGRRAPCWTTA